MSTNQDYLTLLKDRAEFNNLTGKAALDFCRSEAFKDKVELTVSDELELQRSFLLFTEEGFKEACKFFGIDPTPCPTLKDKLPELEKHFTEISKELTKTDSWEKAHKDTMDFIKKGPPSYAPPVMNVMPAKPGPVNN